MQRPLVGFLFAVALGTIVTSPSTVDAQPAKVDPAKAKLAKQYVDAGLAAQNAKDYDTAIGLYEKAYDAVPHPVLLFNIGQAHRLAGRMDKAIEYYERYLAADPKGAQSSIARDYVKEANAKKEAATKEAEAARLAAEQKQAEEQRKADEARKADEQRKADEAAKADEARKAKAAKLAGEHRAAEAAREAEEARNRPGKPLRIAGIAAGGAGVVSVGAAIFFGLRAKSISDELSEPGAVFDPARIDEGESAERNSIILGVAGGALIAGGAAMYYLGHRQRLAASEQVSLVVTPELVGFTVRGVWP